MPATDDRLASLVSDAAQRPAPAVRSVAVRLYASRPFRYLFAPHLVREADCRRLGLELEKLADDGVLGASRWPEHYYFRVRLRQAFEYDPALGRLYWYAWNPLRKIVRFVVLRIARIRASARSARPPEDDKPPISIKPLAPSGDCKPAALHRSIAKRKRMGDQGEHAK